MALQLDAKKEIVKQLSEVASQSISAACANYRGLSVAQMTELREQARKSGVVLRVYRNTLARLAMKDTEYDCLLPALTGPVVLLFSQEEPGAAARLLKTFSKEHKALEVTALALGGQLYAADQLQAIASLPSKDEAIAQLMSVMVAPITKLVRTMAEPYAQVVRVVDAVRCTKQ